MRFVDLTINTNILYNASFKYSNYDTLLSSYIKLNSILEIINLDISIFEYYLYYIKVE